MPYLYQSGSPGFDANNQLDSFKAIEKVSGNPNQYLSSAWINSKVEKFARIANQAATSVTDSENLKK